MSKRVLTFCRCNRLKHSECTDVDIGTISSRYKIWFMVRCPISLDAPAISGVDSVKQARAVGVKKRRSNKPEKCDERKQRGPAAAHAESTPTTQADPFAKRLYSLYYLSLWRYTRATLLRRSDGAPTTTTSSRHKRVPITYRWNATRGTITFFPRPWVQFVWNVWSPLILSLENSIIVPMSEMKISRTRYIHDAGAQWTALCYGMVVWPARAMSWARRDLIWSELPTKYEEKSVA